VEVGEFGKKNTIIGSIFGKNFKYDHAPNLELEIKPLLKPVKF